MSDAAWFVVIFGGLFVARVVAATVVFLCILPDGDRCPHCDAQTLHVQGRRLLRWIPRMRPSWCLRCGWEGLLRRSAQPTGARPTRPTQPAAPR